MTGYKVFIDTAPLIYLLDNDANFCVKTARMLSSLESENATFISSVITCTEYLVAPYRDDNFEKIQAFWNLIVDCPIMLYPITRDIANQAAKIRGKYHFKTMDSLQLAVACVENCDMFLTNDKELKNFEEIRCVTVEEWNLT
ncbi:MAG: PIN domain-containing protein [Selenomonadaceae bacterium]|nr:PIN domain-containing protein [Selenomonadaceae bacterium]MBP3722839.1 PIN domain-containing protein [Selenomonadaceae bacterium]